MKINNFLLGCEVLTNKRCCKRPILRYKNSKIIKFLGLDRIEYYIYCKYWHSAHTKDEMNSPYFHCILCEEPDYFNEYFSLWFENRITMVFTGVPIFLIRLRKHIWHIFALSMMTHSGCSLCSHKYFKNWTREMYEMYRFWDATKPPKRSDDVYWGDN